MLRFKVLAALWVLVFFSASHSVYADNSICNELKICGSWTGRGQTLNFTSLSEVGVNGFFMATLKETSHKIATGRCLSNTCTFSYISSNQNDPTIKYGNKTSLHFLPDGSIKRVTLISNKDDSDSEIQKATLFKSPN